MGKQSSTNPMRAATRLFCETCGGIARRCAVLGLLIFFATNLATSARAQTQATTLPLLLPSATAFDAAGNLYFVDAGDLYIADSHNHRIREVSSPTGTIATIAGTGVAGFSGDGGMATAARLDLPTALALDASGNLYVADTYNHRVRRIAAATGAITTVAGNGIEAFAGDNGPATSASIDSPNGLALDSAGNLYIADTHNGRLRKVSAATGVISTVAGTGVVGGNVQSFGG